MGLNSYNVGVGVAVIIVRDDKLLLNRRIGAHGPGTWAPPGGKLDHNEALIDAAKRETLEETGLVAKELEFIGFTEDVFEEGLHYITFWYLTDNFSGEPSITEPHKCTEQEWFRLEKLPTELFLSFQHAIEHPESGSRIASAVKK